MTTDMLDPPSLFMDGSVGSADIKIDLSDRQPKTLVELLHDGFYLLFMLRRRNNPKDAALFRSSIQMMLTEFEKNAKKLRISAEDVHSAKYAFCALVDEIVLSSHINPLDVLLRQKTRFVAGQFARQYRPVQIGRESKGIKGAKFGIKLAAPQAF